MTRTDHFSPWRLAAAEAAHFDALVALIASICPITEASIGSVGGPISEPVPVVRPRVSSGVIRMAHDGTGIGSGYEGAAVCWAAGRTAAALFRVDGFELAPPFEVVIERSRNIVRLGHTVHRSLCLDPIDRAAVGPIFATSPTRTLIDLASTRDPAMLTRALDSMLRDRLTSEDFLHRRIVALRGKGRYGIPTLLDVIEGAEVTRGGHSWLERRFLAEVGAAGLPRPETQRVMARRGASLVRVDCRFPGTPVVVELLGYRFHRTQAQMRVDAQRMNALVLQGLVPLQFTYVDVVESMPAVLDTVRSALAPFR